MRYYMVALLAIVLDQYTKSLVLIKMKLYESITIMNNFLYITSHRNQGAAFGILQGKWLFFLLITLTVVTLLIYTIWKWRKGSKVVLLSFSFILGGALGNFIDRIRFGEVTDFLDFRFGNYHYPIFNVADSLIVIGVTILLIISLFTPQLLIEKDAS